MGVVVVLAVLFIAITLGCVIDSGDSLSDMLGTLACVLLLWGGLAFACYLAGSAGPESPFQEYGTESGP